MVQVVAGSGDADVKDGDHEDQEAPAKTGPRVPAHARSKPLHWIATAAGVCGVVGLALAVGPAGAVQTGAAQQGAGQPGAAHSLTPGTAPDPAKAKLPIDCGPLPVHIDQHFSAALPGAGTPVTVVAARCEAGAGAPPDGLYVLESGNATAIQLLDPAKRMTVRSMAMRSDGSIHADVIGYSSSSVPDCCPDLSESLDWTLGQAGDWSAPVVTANGAQV